MDDPHEFLEANCNLQLQHLQRKIIFFSLRKTKKNALVIEYNSHSINRLNWVKFNLKEVIIDFDFD